MQAPASSEAGGPEIRWERPIPLLTSRFFLRDAVLAIGVTVVLMYAAVFIMGLIVEGDPVVLPWQFAAIGFGFLGTMFVLVSLLVFQNQFDASFAVSSAGFEVAAGLKVQRVNRVVLVLALLSGRPSAIGPAMLASADQSRAVPWRDVRTVRYHPRDGVVELRDSIFRTHRLFCPPGEYEAIAARVREELARAPRRAKRFDWRDACRRAAWDLAVAAGWFFSVAWYPDATLAWLSWGAVALAMSEWIDWWLGRAVAAAGVASLLVAGALIGVRALESRDIGGLFVMRGYEFDTGLLWITMGGLGLLLLLGARALLRAGARAGRRGARLTE